MRLPCWGLSSLPPFLPAPPPGALVGKGGPSELLPVEVLGVGERGREAQRHEEGEDGGEGSTAERGRGVWRDRSKQEVEDKEKLGERNGQGKEREGELQGGEKGAGGDRVGERKKKAALFTGRTGRVTWELKAQRLGLNWGPEVSIQKP